MILFSDPQDASDSEIALLNENPLFVLMEMMKVLHFRLVDLFHVLDKDNSRCISLDELKEGLEVCISRVVRQPVFCICEKKTQISFAVTAKLISAFVFTTRIVQSLYFLNPKFQASSHLLWLYSPVCVGPGRKPPKTGFLTTRLECQRSV